MSVTDDLLKARQYVLEAPQRGNLLEGLPPSSQPRGNPVTFSMALQASEILPSCSCSLPMRSRLNFLSTTSAHRIILRILA